MDSDPTVDLGDTPRDPTANFGDTRRDPTASPPSPHEASPGTSLGRYVVLETIGQGGMGRVLRAYDPKLQREVALKLVSDDALDAQSRTRMLQEARAMAQLSHPNVVAVYDAEETSAGVMLVMEYVPGATLRQWVQRDEPTWEQIVDHYVRAGHGLAAAHASGLLHRDFKPANVLVADNGAVKVTDFGIAKPTHAMASDDTSDDRWAPTLSPTPAGPHTHTGTVLGTPRYMPPEQHVGAMVDPRADQFAFCVSLWEALSGAPPHQAKTAAALLEQKLRGAPSWDGGGPKIPRWLIDALRRGLAADPEQRWPSMDALLSRLTHARHSRARRGKILTVTALGGLAAVGAWLWSPPAQCTGAREHLRGVWDEQRREQVQVAMLGVGVPYAESAWHGAETAIDEYTDEWVAMHQATCEATVIRREQSAQVMDLQMGCLHRARVQLEAVTAVLLDADVEVVLNAGEIVAGVRPLARCSDVEALTADVEPPTPKDAPTVDEIRGQLAQAHAEHRAGHYARAQDLVHRAKQRLASVDYGPLVAEVALKEAAVLNKLGKYADVEASLKQALESSLSWHQWAEAHHAAVLLISLVGRQLQHIDQALRYKEIAVGLTGSDPTRRADTLMSLAELRFAQGQPDRAEALFRQELEIRERILGSEHPDTLRPLVNLAAVLGQQEKFDEAELVLRTALARQRSALGDNHPRVGGTLTNLGNVLLATGKLAEAEVLLRQALALREATLGPEHPEVSRSLNNLGLALRKQKRYQEAEEVLLRCLEIMSATMVAHHMDIAHVRQNLALLYLVQHRYEDAEREARHNLGIRERARAPEHPQVLAAMDLVSRALRGQGDVDGAIAMYSDALRRREGVMDPEHRSMAELHAELADLLQEAGRPQDARPHYRQALQIIEHLTDTDRSDLSDLRTHLVSTMETLDPPPPAVSAEQTPSTTP